MTLENIELKTPHEIEIMRDNGRILKEILNQVVQEAHAGVNTHYLDIIAKNLILKAQAEPAFLGYQNYPSTLCTSVNEQVVHGIPSESMILKEGDIISLDIGLQKKGFYADMAVTISIGAIASDLQKLLEVTKQSLNLAIKECVVGKRLNDISAAVQVYVESNGFSVVRSYTGHGIGRRMHEPPQVPNWGIAGTGPRLKSGMVLAIEPMVNMGTYETKVLKDGWTVVTADHKPSAHFEHTVAITDKEPLILTG